MKKIFFLGLALCSIVTLFTSCLQSNADDQREAKNLHYALSHSSLNFSLDLSFNKHGEALLSSDEETVISTYLIRLFADLHLNAVNDIEVLTYIDEQAEKNNVIITLLAYGSNNDIASIPIATEFTTTTPELKRTGELKKGITHHCKVDACKCCGFIQREISDQAIFPGVKAVGQKIIGCSCDTRSEACASENGHCNHTIASGS